MHHPWLLSSITIINHHEGEGYEINEIISFPTPWKGNICYSPGEFCDFPTSPAQEALLLPASHDAEDALPKDPKTPMQGTTWVNGCKPRLDQ